MPGTLYRTSGDMLRFGGVLKGSGAVGGGAPDQFSGDRLVEDIRRLLEDGREQVQKRLSV